VKLKRIIEISFIVIVSAALLAQAANIFLGWREGRLVQDEISKGARVSVERTDPRFPPGLLLDFENSSRRTINEIHFRLVFETTGEEVARADRDYGEVKPGEKKKILLKSVALVSSTPALREIKKLRYHLLVFPGGKKPLPEITGEIEIQ
jgi:hypothetical protein